MARPALTIALLLRTRALVDVCCQWLPVNRYAPVDLGEVASGQQVLELLSHQREAVDAVVIEQSLLDDTTRELLDGEGLLFPAVVVGERMGRVDYHPEEVHLPADQLEQLGYNVDAAISRFLRQGQKEVMPEDGAEQNAKPSDRRQRLEDVQPPSGTARLSRRLLQARSVTVSRQSSAR